MLEVREATHVQDLAAQYLGAMSVEERRRNGQTYTPDRIVRFVVEEAGYGPALPIEGTSVLDPACGAGAFLEHAVELLAARLRSLGVDLAERLGRERFLASVASNLFGVDVDPNACRMTKMAVREAVLRATPGVLPSDFFSKNVICADFLLAPEMMRLPPAQEGGFAFIVGNPPYISATRIGNAYKNSLRERFTTATGRLDLYTVFIERSLSLLGRGGRLAFVTPDKFLGSQSARPLRSLILRESAIRTIACFRSHKVFADAATVPCVMVLEHGGTVSDVAVLQCRDEPLSPGRVVVERCSKIPQASLNGDAWNLLGADLDALATRLRARHPSLLSRTVRISAGPATGRDGIYVFPRGTVDVEPELLRPVARGRDLGAYGIDDPALDVLLPYTFDAAGNPSLIRLSAFPKARRYLEKHRSALTARHCVRVWEKAWYDLHDQVLNDLSKQVKILVPDVANQSRFVVDSGRFLPLHSVYYLIPKPDIDPDYLVGVLNSRIAEFLVRLHAPIVKDGFSRYRRQFLATLPVPDAPDDVRERIAAAARIGDSASVNILVADLFGLSPEDAAAIERFLAACSLPRATPSPADAA